MTFSTAKIGLVVVVDLRLFTTEFHQSTLVGEDSFRSSKHDHPSLSVLTKLTLWCYDRCTIHHKQPKTSAFFDRHMQQIHRGFLPFHMQTILVWICQSQILHCHILFVPHINSTMDCCFVFALANERNVGACDVQSVLRHTTAKLSNSPPLHAHLNLHSTPPSKVFFSFEKTFGINKLKPILIASSIVGNLFRNTKCISFQKLLPLFVAPFAHVGRSTANSYTFKNGIILCSQTS